MIIIFIILIYCHLKQINFNLLTIKVIYIKYEEFNISLIYKLELIVSD